MPDREISEQSMFIQNVKNIEVEFQSEVLQKIATLTTPHIASRHWFFLGNFLEISIFETN